MQYECEYECVLILKSFLRKLELKRALTLYKNKPVWGDHADQERSQVVDSGTASIYWG